MFFVRVILFMMSRRADDAVVPSLAKPNHSSSDSRRTSTRHKSIEPTHSLHNADFDNDTVTREEMLKLFGGALRVR